MGYRLGCSLLGLPRTYRHVRLVLARRAARLYMGGHSQRPIQWKVLLAVLSPVLVLYGLGRAFRYVLSGE